MIDIDYDEDDFPTPEEDDYFFNLTSEADKEKYEQLFIENLKTFKEPGEER